MLKKSVFASLSYLSFLIFHNAFTMEQDRHSYHLSIKKIQNSPDQLTIKISKNAQKCSLVANFAAHTCDNEQNLFAPFKTAAGLKTATFGDAANPDSFLWNIPEFGLLKLQRDGSMFFGHGPNDVPLAHDELTFNTPGTLFIESLKVAALKIKSEKAQLCQAVVADRVHADHAVQNSGCLKTKQLEGPGEFLNEALLEFEGTQQKPAILGIKKFQNKNKLPLLAAKTQSSFLRITGDNHCFNNGEGALFEVSDALWVEGLQPGIASLFCNKGSLTAGQFNLCRQAANEGFLQARTMKVNGKPLDNKEFGQVKILEGISVDKTAIRNAGELTTQGNVNLTSAQVENKGTMICRQGNLSCTDAKLKNAGNVLMDGVKSSDALDATNSGTLALKESSLNFGELKNEKDLVLHSGVYAVNALTRNKRLQLLDQDWVITDDPKHQAPHRLLCMNSPEKKSWGASFAQEIECQRNLLYDVEVSPGTVRSQADVCLSSRYLRDINQLRALQTPGKVTAWCKPVNLIREPETAESKERGLWGFSSSTVKEFVSHYHFSNIGHLALNVLGPFTTHYSLKAPTLSMHVHGPLTLGKDNEHLGTLAATHGPLTVIAQSIDGQFGKFYGNGKTLLQSTNEDITIGAPTRGIDETIKQQYANGLVAVRYSMIDAPPHLLDYSLNLPNGAYAASDNLLTLRSAKNILVKYGSVISALGNHLVAPHEIQNFSGKISSQGSTTFEADTYNHTREGAVHKHHPYWTPALQFPGSGPAVLESLKKIDFIVKKVINRAGSMRSGEDIAINGNKNLNQATGYFEEPQHFYCNWFANGDGIHWGPRNTLLLTQSCTTQAGDTITMNLGNFVITGNMNAAGKLSIQANTGLFTNNNSSRQTQIPTQPVVVDVTQYMQDQARRPGMYRLGNNNAVETEFPLGAASAPQDGDRVLLENPGRAAPLAWADIFNPLNSVNLDLHLQQLLANLAGKVYAGKAKGNNLATILWANANKWRQQHGKDVMSPADMKNLNTSMLLCQILNNGLSEQQQILLCIAPADINPYQDRGDIVADAVECITEGDQTHLNNRIVAQGPDGITLTSKAGNVHLETQKYTTVSETDAGTITQQHAMPQQQLIAQSGPVSVTAHGNISRTGTLIAAAGDVDEHAQTGSVIKNPLVLQTTVEKHHKERGLFSTTESTQTTVTHHVVPSTTISGAKLHDKAAVAINAVAPQDSAAQKIIYESPNTIIEGLILANRTTSQSQTSSGFSEQSSFESKETPSATPANIEAKVVEFAGKNARVNANIIAQELRDETEHGAQFVAKVAQMLCSGQSLAASPFMSADAGYTAGYETMIPPMLMVEKIVRTKDAGHMVFESAIIDKNRTEIIGKFVETTYHLKQWQTSWNHRSQLIPDEALIVVALAVTLATQGAGVELLSPLLTNITAATGMQLSAAGIAMVNAGVSTICSSGATSFLRTGDPINTVAQLASPEQLKSIAFSMASAGLCSQLGDILNVNMKSELKSLASHVKEQALRGTVDALLNVAIHDAPIDKALGDACKQIPLKAAAAYAANKICTAYMDTISQKAAHTLVGGLSGFAMQNSSKGFVAGATGALTAELIGDYLVADAQAISDAAIARLEAKGQPLTLANIQQAIVNEVHVKTNIAKIAAGAVAVLTHQNPEIAISAATNAVDNDVAIRGSLYALSEFQALVSAASQALATLHTDKESAEKLDENKKQRNRATAAADDTALDKMARDLVLQAIEGSLPAHDDRLIQYAQEQLTQPPHQRSLHDRIVNPDTPAWINESSEIIRIAFVDAVNKTVNLFSMAPNPVGLACLAAGTTRDIYQGTTTPGEVIFDSALAYGALKGIQLTGKGIKILYQQGKGMIKDVTEKVHTRLRQPNNEPSIAIWSDEAITKRMPFVENPHKGLWTDAAISGDLVLVKGDMEYAYKTLRSGWSNNPNAPFNVASHGSITTIKVEAATIHPKGLSQTNLALLKEMGFVRLTAVQAARLIRTAPGYEKGQAINLFACNCGKDPQGIAQKIADRMGVTVTAYTDSLGTFVSANDLIFKFGNIYEGMQGVWKTFYPSTLKK